MATTTSGGGNLTLDILLQLLLGGDQGGGPNVRYRKAITLAASGGAAPTFSTGFKGTAACAAGDWLLAHATDPLQGMGDAAYLNAVPPTGLKLKLWLIGNEDTANSITWKRKTTNGLTVIDTASAGLLIPFGGLFLWYDPTGIALTTGTNDGVTIAVGGGSPAATVLAAYGP